MQLQVLRLGEWWKAADQVRRRYKSLFIALSSDRVCHHLSRPITRFLRDLDEKNMFDWTMKNILERPSGNWCQGMWLWQKGLDVSFPSFPISRQPNCIGGSLLVSYLLRARPKLPPAEHAGLEITRTLSNCQSDSSAPQRITRSTEQSYQQRPELQTTQEWDLQTAGLK